MILSMDGHLSNGDGFYGFYGYDIKKHKSLMKDVSLMWLMNHLLINSLEIKYFSNDSNNNVVFITWGCIIDDFPAFVCGYLTPLAVGKLRKFKSCLKKLKEFEMIDFEIQDKKNLRWKIVVL